MNGTLSFDPNELACVGLSPVPPFDHAFDYTIDNAAGTAFVEAYAPPGAYVLLGDFEHPTEMFTVIWDVAPWEGGHGNTEVTVESCEFATSVGSMRPVPHRTTFALGEPPPEPPGGVIPAVSTWGLLILALLLSTAGKIFHQRSDLQSAGANRIDD
jgi:hypothetical protein